MSCRAKLITLYECLESGDSSWIPSRTNMKKFYNLLEELVNAEFDAGDAERFIDCLVKYIDRALNHFSLCKLEKQTILRAQTYFQIIFEVLGNSSILNLFVAKATNNMIDLILEENNTLCKKHLLKTFNLIVSNSLKTVKLEALSKMNDYYPYKLVDLLCSSGDYDLQMSITELIFRLYEKKSIEAASNRDSLFPECDNFDALFLSIDLKNFDASVRQFLNQVNEKYQKVFSILCRRVAIEDLECDGPSGLEHLNGLWVDFNLKENSISWFCNKPLTSTENNIENVEDIWDLVCLYATDVSELKITEKNLKISVKFSLKSSCISRFSDTQVILDKLKNLELLIDCSEESKLLEEKIIPMLFKDIVGDRNVSNDSIEMAKISYNPKGDGLDKSLPWTNSIFGRSSAKSPSTSQNESSAYETVEMAPDATTVKVSKFNNESSEYETATEKLALPVENVVVTEINNVEEELSESDDEDSDNLREDINRVMILSGRCSGEKSLHSKLRFGDRKCSSQIMYKISSKKAISSKDKEDSSQYFSCQIGSESIDNMKISVKRLDCDKNRKISEKMENVSEKLISSILQAEIDKVMTDTNVEDHVFSQVTERISSADELEVVLTEKDSDDNLPLSVFRENVQQYRNKTIFSQKTVDLQDVEYQKSIDLVQIDLVEEIDPMAKKVSQDVPSILEDDLDKISQAIPKKQINKLEKEIIELNDNSESVELEKDVKTKKSSQGVASDLPIIQDVIILEDTDHSERTIPKRRQRKTKKKRIKTVKKKKIQLNKNTESVELEKTKQITQVVELSRIQDVEDNDQNESDSERTISKTKEDNNESDAKHSSKLFVSHSESAAERRFDDLVGRTLLDSKNLEIENSLDNNLGKEITREEQDISSYQNTSVVKAKSLETSLNTSRRKRKLYDPTDTSYLDDIAEPEEGPSVQKKKITTPTKLNNTSYLRNNVLSVITEEKSDDVTSRIRKESNSPPIHREKNIVVTQAIVHTTDDDTHIPKIEIPRPKKRNKIIQSQEHFDEIITEAAPSNTKIISSKKKRKDRKQKENIPLAAKVVEKNVTSSESANDCYVTPTFTFNDLLASLKEDISISEEYWHSKSKTPRKSRNGVLKSKNKLNEKRMSKEVAKRKNIKILSNVLLCKADVTQEDVNKQKIEEMMTSIEAMMALLPQDSLKIFLNQVGKFLIRICETKKEYYESVSLYEYKVLKKICAFLVNCKIV